MNPTNEEQQEYELLVTRLNLHQKSKENQEKGSASTQIRKTNYLTKWLSCRSHMKHAEKSCSECFILPVQDHLPNGKLPTGEQVLGYLFFVSEQMRQSGKLGNSVVRDVAGDLLNHWINCNIYTQTLKSVTEKLQTLADRFKKLKKYPANKRTDPYFQKLTTLKTNCRGIFDIRTQDSARQKQQEAVHNVKETKLEVDFYEGQCKIPQEGHCSSQVDRAWQRAQKRKEERTKSMEKKRADLAEISNTTLDDGSDDDNYENDDPADDDYVPDSKKGKFDFNMFGGKKNDDMPHEYCHPRSGLRSVNPILYTVMFKLASELHMSKRQIEGAIIIIANSLFGRTWKPYNKNSTPDLDTLPSMANVRENEPLFEVLALNSIVEELMEEGNRATVYANDGSSRSGVGSYVVQSLTINGNQRALPTFGVFTESRESLKELEVTTLKILSAASLHKYSEKDILNKIDFVMTDSTSHNLEVIEEVCEELEVENVPGTLLCNIHPLMMFQGKIKELCQEIHDSLGKRKISECFLVDVEFRNESFVVKSLKCLSNFINCDNSAKPWNRYSHFSNFILPKQNFSISLKDHRFNRLNDCATSVLYHMDDIANYLDQFCTIINGITILDRSFLEMEVLKPIYAAISLVGLHILKPFHKLILDKETKYSTLMIAFPKLHEELLSISPVDMLSLNQVFHFAKEEHFKEAFPNTDLSTYLEIVAKEYKREVCQLLQILLKKFAYGFQFQKGAIIGFGEKKDEDTGTVLRICQLGEEKVEVIDNVQIHNLDEERSVGFINYELDIRGKQNLEAVSRKMVLNKSADLTDGLTNFKQFRKLAAEIKEYKLAWNNRMEQMEKIGYSKKELACSTVEKTRLDDLDYLQKQPIPGPISSSAKITKFMESEPESKQKNQHMYIEVRFQRNSTQSLKKDAAVFRLKQNGRNLETDEYASNLSLYLDQSRSMSSLTLGDLRNVLTGLSGGSQHDLSSQIAEDQTQQTELICTSTSINSHKHKFEYGEHIACVWYDDNDNKHQWHLGVVDGMEGEKVKVSYMKMSDRKGQKWLFPEEADVHSTSPDQIIMRHIPVMYSLTAMIRCEISCETLEQIVACFNKID